MKKLISLVLALALVLTAVSALAELVVDTNEKIVEEIGVRPINSVELAMLMKGLTPSAADVEVALNNLPEALQEKLKDKITITNRVVDPEQKTLLDRVTDPKNEVNLENLYVKYPDHVSDVRAEPKGTADLAEAVSVALMDMPMISIIDDENDLTEEEKNTLIPIEIKTNKFTNDYLNQFNTETTILMAVFSYEKDGEIFSCIIDYEFKHDVNTDTYSIVYYIPLGVLADASGCETFVNFVVEPKEVQE